MCGTPICMTKCQELTHFLESEATSVENTKSDAIYILVARKEDSQVNSDMSNAD